MNCPKCDLKISDYYLESGNKCNSCRYKFPENQKENIVLLLKLEKRIDNLIDLKTNFANQVEELSFIKDDLKTKIESSFTTSKKITNDFEENKNEPKVENYDYETVQEIIKPKENSKTQFIRDISAKVSQNWEMILGFNGFLILGIISIIFGISFFIRKAFVSGWLDPVGKVTIIYLSAIISLGIGNYFKKKRFPEFGLALIGMGSAILYYSTYAAFNKYNLFDQNLSFLLMIVITIFVVVISVVENNKWLAVLGLIGGFSTPIMISSGSKDILALFLYITILNIGLLAIAIYKRWNLINNLGFFFTYAIYLTTYNHHIFWISAIFINLFFLIYSLIPFIYNFFQKDHEKFKNISYIFLNSFIALGVNYHLIKKNQISIEYLSLITICYAIIFLLMATYLFKKQKQTENVFFFILSKAAFFLILTIPILASKQIITIFWSVQFLVIMWLAIKVKNEKLLLTSYILLILVTFKLFSYDYFDVFRMKLNFTFRIPYTKLLMERYSTLLIYFASFYTFLNLLRKSTFNFKSNDKSPLYFFFIINLISLFLVLNIEVSAFFYEYSRNLQFVALSILWGLFAIILVLIGLKKQNHWVRKIGFGLFFATLTKVFLYDISAFSTSYKFISFIVIGLFLIFTSYLYRIFKDNLELIEPEQSDNLSNNINLDKSGNEIN